MYLEITTPEEILLSSEVTSVSVPGVNGTFQILDNHAPIIATLQEGNLKINGQVDLDKKIEGKFTRDENNHLIFPIKGGVVETKENKTIVLVD